MRQFTRPHATAVRGGSWHDIASFEWSTIASPRIDGVGGGSIISDSGDCRMPHRRSMSCRITGAALRGRLRLRIGQRRTEDARAGRPLRPHHAADQRPDLRADPPDRSPGDGPGQEGRRPAGADLRVRRAQGPEELRPRERIRRGPRPGQLPLQRRTQRRADRGLRAPVDPGARRAGGAGLPGNRHGQRRLDRSGGHRREDDHAHAAERLHGNRQPAADRARGTGAGHARPGRRSLAGRDRGGQRVRHARGPGATEERAHDQGAGGGEAGRRVGRVLRQRGPATELRQLPGRRSAGVGQGAGVAAGGRRGRSVVGGRLAAGPRRSEGPHPRRFGPTRHNA